MATRTTRSNKADRQHRRVLPESACPSCGTEMKEAIGPLDFPVNGEEVSVPTATHLRCPHCQEIVLRADEARKLRERAHEIYQKEHTLLTADEIRTLRERLGLTQARLARLLKLGANTISRWEAGRTIQTAAMDMLLRLIRDVPGVWVYLERREDFEIPKQNRVPFKDPLEQACIFILAILLESNGKISISKFAETCVLLSNPEQLAALSPPYIKDSIAQWATQPFQTVAVTIWRAAYEFLHGNQTICLRRSSAGVELELNQEVIKEVELPNGIDPWTRLDAKLALWIQESLEHSSSNKITIVAPEMEWLSKLEAA